MACDRTAVELKSVQPVVVDVAHADADVQESAGDVLDSADVATDCTSVRLVEGFHEKYKRKDIQPQSWKQIMQSKLSALATTKWWVKTAKRNFPFIRTFRGYEIKQDFPSDFVSGLTVGIMQIPQSMAYAMLASLPPICGLYTALFAPIIYFFIGSSRHISMGVIAIVSLMIGAVLDRELGVTDDDVTEPGAMMSNETSGNTTLTSLDVKKIQIATALSFVSGLFMILFGKLGLGIVTSYMSEPLVSGFTTGAATHVITSQTWIAFFSNIAQTNFAALIMSLICMLVLYLVKIQVNQRFKSKLKVPIPIELLVVILGTLASHFGYFNDKYGLSIVEDIPAGMPVPRIPDLQLARNCIFDAIIIGIVAFAQSVSMAKIFAKKNSYKIDSDQEMVGYGAGSVFASIFSGYITAASVARSSVQESAGGKTQLASLFSCTIVFVVVMAVGPLFYNLPTCVLAGVIIVSLRSLFLQVFDLKPLWKVSKFDFAIWVVTFLGVVVLDADIGLGIGILFSLLTVVVRGQRVKSKPIGKVQFTGTYKPKADYISVYRIKGVSILSFNSSVYFANSDRFVNGINKALEIDPAKEKRKQRSKSQEIQVDSPEGKDMDENGPMKLHLDEENRKLKENAMASDRKHGIRHVVLDCSGISFVDTMGVKAFKEVILDYSSIDIEVYLAECRDEVTNVFQATDFWQKYKDRIYVNIDDAISSVTEKLT